MARATAVLLVSTSAELGNGVSIVVGFLTGLAAGRWTRATGWAFAILTGFANAALETASNLSSSAWFTLCAGMCLTDAGFAGGLTSKFGRLASLTIGPPGTAIGLIGLYDAHSGDAGVFGAVSGTSKNIDSFLPAVALVDGIGNGVKGLSR